MTSQGSQESLDLGPKEPNESHLPPDMSMSEEKQVPLSPEPYTACTLCYMVLNDLRF